MTDLIPAGGRPLDGEIEAPSRPAVRVSLTHDDRILLEIAGLGGLMMSRAEARKLASKIEDMAGSSFHRTYVTPARASDDR